MSEENLIVEKKGAVATLIINRPGQRNAILREMWVRLPEILDGLETDGQTRVVIIRGAGEKAFASGQDISELRASVTPGTAAAHSELLEKVWAHICEAALPIIAMVHGFAMGGAAGLLAACDLRYASEDAIVAVPAARLGVVYPELLTRRIADLIGPARTKEMLMTARRYSAAEAYEMGFFNRVLPKDALEAYTHEVARTIAENAPVSVRGAKEMVNLIQAQSLDSEKAERARALRLSGFQSADFREGVEAFLDKRPPVFGKEEADLAP